MKIRSLTIIDIDYKPLMKGVDLFFSESEDEFIHSNCLIGINGSGKSQILEIIAEIFLFLDNLYRTENTIPREVSSFAFRIQYEFTLGKAKYLVSIHCPTINCKKKDLEIEILDAENKEVLFDEEEFYKYLPLRVVGYTSGDNETLSLPFDLYYDEYAKYTGNRALNSKKYLGSKDYDPRLYFMNYNTNLGITISSLIFEEDNEGIDVIKSELNISKLVSFKIIIQTNQMNAPFYDSKGDGGIMLTKELEEWRDKLIKCCPKAVQDENDIKFKRWILEYELNDDTKKLFKYHFKNALELYTALYKLELLNNLIIKDEIVKKIKNDRKERKLVTRMPMVPEDDKVLSYSELKLELNNGNIVDYLSLSDGEHQFLNVFGTILMINQDNCLFLLDEPETHFNPKWRRTFISTLKKITKGRLQDMFITSHSPFVVSDSKNENVFIFKRQKEKVDIYQPNKETYGAAFDEILRMAFDIEIPISEESLSLIQSLEDSTDIKFIEENITELGESHELNAVYRRLEFLKAKSKK
ncbi:restriction system-associated AAA family ATPase [uncultured Chryseobacterium sp.]|uniref:restriction system-associated AAA family ATPase n=1 Tax=uncultured Chryseobacterium sp. TaxID=259322 RepID=UPI0025F2B152|nr:restriction system-associated AAA family ATPase [uncultured Chryseobacterium sp.]